MGKSFIIGLIVLFLATSLLAAPEGFNADSVFTGAGKLYADNLYPEALAEYLKLEQRGTVSAALYYNIGNCYYQMGELGYAILYYMRAQRLNPVDEDINNNLEFARQFMAVSLEGVRINPVTDFMDAVVRPFTLNDLAWISSGLFILFILLLAAILHFRFAGTMTRMMVYILGIILICSAVLTTYKYRTDYMAPKGVIVASEAGVYSGPDENRELEFTGSYGLVFKVERQEKDYYLVMFENRRKGWIHKDRVELL